MTAGLSDSAAGFAVLYGSPKQVAWADEIREALYARCEREYAAALEGAGADAVEAGKAARAAEHALAAMRGEASASWWIDSRCETPHAMLGRVAARSKDPSAAKVAELADVFRRRLRTSRFFVMSNYSFVARESDGGRVYIKAARYLSPDRVSKTIKCGYVRDGEYVVPGGEYNILEDWFE